MKVRIKHEGVVKIRSVEVCEYNDIFEIYIDIAKQKYPKSHYSTTLGCGEYYYTICVESQTGRGIWTHIDLIPEGRRERRLFRNGDLVHIWTRYAICWRIVPSPDRRRRHKTLYKKDLPDD